jgi:hypothetical protein
VILCTKEKAEQINIGKRKEEEISLSKKKRSTERRSKNFGRFGQKVKVKEVKKKEEITAVKHEVEGPKKEKFLDKEKAQKK